MTCSVRDGGKVVASLSIQKEVYWKFIQKE